GNQLPIGGGPAVNRSFRSYRAGFPPIDILDETASRASRLVSGDEDMLAVRHPVESMAILLDATLVEFPDRARSGWQQLNLGIRNSGDYPFPVGQKIPGHAFPQRDRRRALQIANRVRVSGTGLLSLLVEEHQASVMRHIHRQRPVEPGKV